MGKIYQRFPNVREPKFLEPREFTQHLTAYKNWFFSEIKKACGNGSVKEFVQIVQEIEAVRALSLGERALQVGIGGGGKRFSQRIAELGKPALELVPVRELGSDIIFLIAESADLLLRTVDETDRARKKEYLIQITGTNSLEEVKNLFSVALAQYAQCAEKIKQQKNDENGVTVILPQIGAKAITSTIRKILLSVSLEIEKCDFGVKFEIANFTDVFPHILKQPKLRDMTLDGTDIVHCFNTIELTQTKHFGSKHGAMCFYTNLGVLCLILGEYKEARHALMIAAEYTPDEIPNELQIAMKFLNTVSPQTSN